jgi:hypothetical protein
VTWEPITPQERTLGVSPHYPRNLTPDTCVKQGGHCWVRDSMVAMTSPPIYTEYCKHCPAYRKGRPQEAIAWGEPQVPS